MTGTLVELWRHPIKAHGREQLAHVLLTEGRTMPWDRRWAVAHEASRFDPAQPAWVPCNQFSIGSKAPALTAIKARVDHSAHQITLSHPDLPDITFDPDDPQQAGDFIQWVMPLCPTDRPLPARLVRVPGRGMTDTDYPSVSLMNLSSHRAVAQRIGRDISHLRWRINLVFDGLAPWEEFDWIGKSIRIGRAELRVTERIRRCMMTTANPETGRRDTDTLGALRDGWGHQDFGVYARVVKTGEVAQGDTLEVLG